MNISESEFDSYMEITTNIVELKVKLEAAKAENDLLKKDNEYLREQLSKLLTNEKERLEKTEEVAKVSYNPPDLDKK